MDSTHLHLSSFLDSLFLSSFLLFCFFPSPPAIEAELGEAVLTKTTNVQIESITFSKQSCEQACNICVVQVVGEYFYSDLGEASDLETDNG